MEYKFIIDGRFYKNNTFPDLNNYLAACSRHPMQGATMKKKYKDIARDFARKQLPGVVIENPVMIHYDLYEASRKRDPSNVASFAVKCIEDALQDCNILANDGWANIAGYSQEIHLDRENPRIEVLISEVAADEKSH